MQPLPDPVQPTTQNIAKAKINLTNMQRFNDLLYTYTLTKCANGFILLSRPDNSDPGMNVGVNLVCGAIIGVGGEFGILGCVVANYFCGLISEFSETKPPSLLIQYTSYTTRIQATSIQADEVMARDYSDPVNNWDKVKTGTFNGPWGSQTLGCSLGQVAAIDFPAETDPLFDQIMAKAIYSFDQSLWWDILNKNFQINGWNTGFLLPTIIPVSNVPKRDEGMNNYSDVYMMTNPAHWTFWYETQSYDKKGRDTSTYTIMDYSLGSEPGNRNKDQPISNEAANYLFIDTIPGNIINPIGLFNRYFVFNDFGLKKIEQVV